MSYVFYSLFVTLKVVMCHLFLILGYIFLICVIFSFRKVLINFLDKHQTKLDSQNSELKQQVVSILTSSSCQSIGKKVESLENDVNQLKSSIQSFLPPTQS